MWKDRLLLQGGLGTMQIQVANGLRSSLKTRKLLKSFFFILLLLVAVQEFCALCVFLVTPRPRACSAFSVPRVFDSQEKRRQLLQALGAPGACRSVVRDKMRIPRQLCAERSRWEMSKAVCPLKSGTGASVTSFIYWRNSRMEILLQV